MASETNELTFVRCPTCRSLVPASASRCRICNATLEVGEQKTPSADQAAAARVRQKTVTATPEEVRSFTAGSQESPASSPPPSVGSPIPTHAPQAAPVSGTSSQVNDDSFDPLGAFLNDLDAEEPAPKAAPKAAQHPPVRDPIEDLFGDDDEGDGELATDLAADKSDGLEEDDLDDFDLDIFDDPSFDELGAVVEEAPPAQMAPPEPELPPQAPPPRQPPQRPAPPPKSPPVAKQEAGGRERPQQNQPQKPPRGEERFSQGVQQPQQEQRKQQTAPAQRSPNMGMRPKQTPRQEVKPTPPIKPQMSPATPGGQRPAESREAQKNWNKNQPNQQPRRPEQPEKRNLGEARAEPPRAERQERRTERAPDYESDQEQTQLPSNAGGPKLSKMKPGRLFGWLVSFESPDGRAIELRSGRFFVTGTSIRGSDLILEDQSISTPHALMSINEKGFLLQDLMSDRGTFVRSQGEAQYRREESIIEVQHGDWIRFGDVEFLVTIVPA